jgi:C4-dicarboxylate-specific signal transduction histidine kinase
MTERVLLVDDSNLVRDYVGSLIADWGFQVETVGSGRAALAALEQSPFDVIVAEVRMPEMSGLELLTTLRVRGVSAPVIMLSSVSRTSDILSAIHHGAFDYVVRDQAIEPLRLALLRAMQHVHLVRENTRLGREIEELSGVLEARVRERTAELAQDNARLIAERGQIESALARVSEGQEQLVQVEKMASIGLLTAGIAHEINNPLAFLLPNFELIEAWLASAQKQPPSERGSTLDELAKLVSECRTGLDRIARLVRQLRVFSHPGRQNLEPVDVDAVVRSVVGFVEREARGRAEVRIYSAGQCMVRSNEDHLRQVLLNLVLNSVQSLDPARGAGCIDVVVEPKDGEVIVRVIDNGCGIAPENLRRVFDPFFTTKAVGFGTGLGLSISRDLVKKMDGNITLESQLDQGTVVTVTLQRWRERIPTHEVLEALRTPTPELLPSKVGRRLSIIVIEDETALLAPLRRMLAAYHDIITFSDPRDGMRCLIEQQPPDVIICDINMPMVDGVELYREVTRVRPFLARRFVFLTGGVSEEAATLLPGDSRILEKPVHRDELIAAIEDIAAMQD